MQQQEFVRRRAALAKTMTDGDVMVFFSGETLRKTADEMYPFFTDRNFLYLTGVCQADTALVLTCRGGAVTETLFAPKPDEFQEIWHGRRLRDEELTALSGVAAVRDIAGLERTLHGLFTTWAETLWLNLDVLEPNQAPNYEQRYAAKVRDIYPQLRIRSSYPLVAHMRRIKSPAEVEAIRKAMEMTNLGIRRMMRFCRPGVMEYELEGEFLHELSRHGQRAPAFPSIVAAGERNFYLHYPLPMEQVADGDLVLTDVGAGYDGYSTDVSRVFPANGRFTEKQAQIYAVALAANRAMLREMGPGKTFDFPNRLCQETAFEGLKALGLLDDFADIRRYVWHGTTHHVGLDTHDVGGYEGVLEPGMVVTADAGVYVREWGIGLRVEDTVLITETGCVNLSAAIPSEMADIEAACQGD